jgi:phosphopantothenoylcysteine synthetase/decarboxylase
MTKAPVLGLVCSAAGGVESIRAELVEPLVAEGWTVAVTATPTAYRWLTDLGEVALIERATGLPVRHEPRLPREDSPHPEVDCYAVVPATANTVAKLALGIADNQAVTQVCEALGAPTTAVVVFPRVNAAHAGHPAWRDHLSSLRRAGACLVGAEDAPPPSTSDEFIPWAAIRSAIHAAVALSADP